MISTDQLQALVALLFAHSWVAASAVFAGLVVRVLKDDRVPIPLDKRWRPAASAAVGMLCGGLNAAVEGAPLLPSLALGLLGGTIAVLGHVYGIEMLRDGKELFPAPKAEGGGEEDDDEDSGPPTPRGGAASTLAFVLMMVGALTFGSACAAVAKILPAIAAEVTRAVLAIDTVEAFAKSYFESYPDPKHEELVSQAIGRARSAAEAVERARAGTEDLTQNRIDEAAEEFRRAWIELERAVAGIPGLRIVGAGDSAGLDRVVPGEVVVVRPALAEESLEP